MSKGNKSDCVRGLCELNAVLPSQSLFRNMNPTSDMRLLKQNNQHPNIPIIFISFHTET